MTAQGMRHLSHTRYAPNHATLCPQLHRYALCSQGPSPLRSDRQRARTSHAIALDCAHVRLYLPASRYAPRRSCRWTP